MRLRLYAALCFLCSATALQAELAIEVEDYVLPRTAEFTQLPVTITIDDVLPSDYDKHDREEHVWERLQLLLPDSEESDRPLYRSYELGERVGYHRHYWYEVVDRKKNTNHNGNLTVVWRLLLKARKGHQLSAIVQGSPPALRLAISYHQWEDDEYGEALLSYIHFFARLDGVPAEAPQQVHLTPRHHRLHVSWELSETVDYSNEQGKFPPAGVIAIVATSRDTPIDMTVAARLFRPAADGGDVPLNEGQCQLLPDCQIDCGDHDNVYFDIDKIKTVEGLQNSKLIMQSDTGTIHNLQPGADYQVMLQYYPDGIKRSTCLTATPTENKTLLELNGTEAAERADLRCFIASAATGSTRALTELRGWRDNFLLPYAWGQALTSLYYHHAPPIAQMIAAHELLQVLTRILLLVPLIFVLICKYPLLALLCVVLLAFHRRLPASACRRD